MSVLVVDLKVYEQIYNKIISFKHNNTVNINYCNTFASWDNEETIKEVVRNWCWLNEWSFNRKYNEPNEKLYKLLNLRFSGPACSTYQLLKWLECIRYNIELDTIRQGRTADSSKIIISAELLESYKYLEAFIQNVMTTCVSQIPEYKAAEWC